LGHDGQAPDELPHFSFGVLFKPLLKAAKLPDMQFHDLRHTSASLLLAQGVHPKIVQERLGHSQIGITLDTYSHVLPTLGVEAANKLDIILRGKPARRGRVLSAGQMCIVVRHCPPLAAARSSNVFFLVRHCLWRSPSKIGYKLATFRAEEARREDARRKRNARATPNTGVVSRKRRARDSNPQPVSRHLISSQAANHSLTLRGHSSRVFRDRKADCYAEKCS